MNYQNKKKRKPITLKNSSPQSQNLQKAPTLHHMRIAFPKSGGRARITIVDGAYQIQYFTPTFGLWTRCLNSLMEVLFNSFQNRQGRIHILLTIKLPIQGQFGR
jgi:hypothetical protein